MSNFYNALHGYEPSATAVLQILGVRSTTEIVRFRDAYLTYRDDTNEPIMIILARTGSTAWTDQTNDHLKELPGFIDSQDDEFDTSFALFRYTLPDDAELRELATSFLNEYGRPLTLRQKTDQAIGPDQTRRQKIAGEEVAKQILDAIKEQE